jgi:lipopolysaccharide assembly protein A
LKIGGTEMNYKIILGFLLAGIAVLFIIQNVPSVELTFLFWTISMSRALLMFLILSAGIILGWLLHGRVRRIKTIPIQNKAL